MSVGDYLELNRGHLMMVLSRMGVPTTVVTENMTSEELMLAIRERQPAARTHPLLSLYPRWLGPALATSLPELGPRKRQELEGRSLVADSKVDGFRIILVLRGGHVGAYGRMYHPSTFLPQDFTPRVRHLLTGVPHDVDAVLDCEYRYPADLPGCKDCWETSAQFLQHMPIEMSVELQGRNPPGGPVFHVLDCLRWDGVDMTGLPLVKRKEWAAQAVSHWGHPLVTLVPHVRGTWESILPFLTQAVGDGYEGMVVKPADAPYEFRGRRPRSGWVKVKPTVGDRTRATYGQTYGTDAVVSRVSEDGHTVGLVVSVQNPNGSRGQRFLGDAQVPEGLTLSEGQVVEFDAAYLDQKTGQLRHAHVRRLRADKPAGDCLLPPEWWTAMALRVRNV